MTLIERLADPSRAHQTYANAADRSDALAEIERLTAQVEMMREALEWYAKQGSGCRKLTSEGNDARRLLDADGGSLAHAAMSYRGGD